MNWLQVTLTPSLKDVWIENSKIWNAIQELKPNLWHFWLYSSRVLHLDQKIQNEIYKSSRFLFRDYKEPSNQLQITEFKSYLRWPQKTCLHDMPSLYIVANQFLRCERSVVHPVLDASKWFILFRKVIPRLLKRRFNFSDFSWRTTCVGLPVRFWSISEQVCMTFEDIIMQ